jgi:hypothetical protein
MDVSDQLYEPGMKTLPHPRYQLDKRLGSGPEFVEK